MTAPAQHWQQRYGVPPAGAEAIAAALAALGDAPEVPEAPEVAAAVAELERLFERIAAYSGPDQAAALAATGEPQTATALARMAYAAPFLLQRLASRPGMLADGLLSNLGSGPGLPPFSRHGTPEGVSELDEQAFMSALRRWKYETYLRLTARDLCGLQDTAATCRQISQLAEGMLRAAYAWCFVQAVRRFGVPILPGGVRKGAAAQGGVAAGIVIGMGKLGGGELNYASDVDVIFAHAGERAVCRPLAALSPPPLHLDRPEAEYWAAWEQRVRDCGEAKDSGEAGASGDAVGGTVGDSASVDEFHYRLAKQVIRVLSAKTADGIGFRVDADLRPQGRGGLLVPSLEQMEGYYLELGREWERTAMIKARVLAGPADLAERFGALIRPFVYRRYLDFSAVEGIAIVKHDINRAHSSAQGSNIKLGPGGIRESEFLVQALQLLYGGKKPRLQVSSHPAAVAGLEAEGLMQPQDAQHALADYWRLRTVENRIQMVAEEQTHDLPVPLGALQRVLHDFAPNFGERLAAAQAALAQARADTAQRFGLLFEGMGDEGFPDAEHWRHVVREQLADAAAAATRAATEAPTGVGEDPMAGGAEAASGPPETAQAEASPTQADGKQGGGAVGDGALSDGALSDGALSDLALSDGALSDLALSDGALSDGALTPADAAVKRVDGLFAALMHSRSGERCTFKLAKLLVDPNLYRRGTQHAFPLWLRFFEQIGNRNALYALLETHPPVVPWVSHIFSEGGRHAELLIRHPEFLETFFALQEDWSAMAGEFREISEGAADEEEFVLALQNTKAQWLIRILTRYLQQDESAGHRLLLSDLADATVRACADFAWRRLTARRGEPEGAAPGALSGFAVLALGKQGSRELRFGSDLDLVFVYDGEGTTTGGSSHYEFYTKLAQRIGALLTTPTQFGKLYDLDHRLRPFGSKGLLVPSLAAYRKYLAGSGEGGAEVWNFQAFTRMRTVCGDGALGAALAREVAQAWRERELPCAQVASAVRDMLGRLVEEHALSDRVGAEVIALKYAVGGMIGYEFLQQAHFLCAASNNRESAAGWTAPPLHETLAQLAADYEQVSALDELLSFHVPGHVPGRGPEHGHTLRPEQVEQLAAVGARWGYEAVLARCKRMSESVEAAFRALGAASANLP